MIVLIHLLLTLPKKRKSLSTIPFNKDDIAKIMKNHESGKTHSYGMIRELILKPSPLTFRSCAEGGNFPSYLKYVTVKKIKQRLISIFQ